MVIATTAGYGVTMDTLASTAANFVGGVRPEIAAFVGGGKREEFLNVLLEKVEESPSVLHKD